MQEDQEKMFLITLQLELLKHPLKCNPTFHSIFSLFPRQKQLESKTISKTNIQEIFTGTIINFGKTFHNHTWTRYLHHAYVHFPPCTSTGRQLLPLLLLKQQKWIPKVGGYLGPSLLQWASLHPYLASLKQETSICPTQHSWTGWLSHLMYEHSLQ